MYNKQHETFSWLYSSNWPFSTIILLEQLLFFVVKSFLLKTHLMETRRMEHKNALDFYTLNPPPFLSSKIRPNTKLFVLSLLCYRLNGQMVFYSHIQCVVGLDTGLIWTTDDGEGTTSGGLMLSKLKSNSILNCYTIWLGAGTTR